MLDAQHIYIVHYGHNKIKYDQIMKIYLEIFRGIDYYNLSLFNVHNDIKSSNNMHSDSKCFFFQTEQIISDFGKSRV